MSMWPIKTSATPSSTQRKNQFHADVGKTTDHAGMRSARLSTRHFFGHRRVSVLTELPCLPDLIKGERNAGQRQLMPSGASIYAKCWGSSTVERGLIFTGGLEIVKPYQRLVGFTPQIPLWSPFMQVKRYC